MDNFSKYLASITCPGILMCSLQQPRVIPGLLNMRQYLSNIGDVFTQKFNLGSIWLAGWSGGVGLVVAHCIIVTVPVPWFGGLGIGNWGQGLSIANLFILIKHIASKTIYYLCHIVRYNAVLKMRGSVISKQIYIYFFIFYFGIICTNFTSFYEY